MSRRQLTIAKRPQDLQPGQLVVLDGRGRPLTFWRRQLSCAGQGLLIGGAGAAIGAAIGVSLWVTVPAVYLTMVGRGKVAHRLWWPLVNAQSLLAAGDIEAGAAALAAAPSPRRGARAVVRARLEGYVAEATGKRAEAIACYQRALDLRAARVNRILVQARLIIVLARDGQIDRAAELRDRVHPPSGADWLILGLVNADLTLAIAGSAEASLDQDTLDDWLRSALAHNHTQDTLLLLARVLAARGDDDLAEHCLAEAEERFTWCSLDTTWPELAPWVRPGDEPAVPHG